MPRNIQIMRWGSSLPDAPVLTVHTSHQGQHEKKRKRSDNRHDVGTKNKTSGWGFLFVRNATIVFLLFPVLFYLILA